MMTDRLHLITLVASTAAIAAIAHIYNLWMSERVSNNNDNKKKRRNPSNDNDNDKLVLKSGYVTNIAHLIGNTPMIKIESLSRYTGCTILGKAEFMNIGKE